MQAFFAKKIKRKTEVSSQSGKFELTREELGAILTMNTYLVGVGILRPAAEKYRSDL